MKSEHSSASAFRTALFLNAAFLVLTVVLVHVGFESNDDLTLAAFVDGQMAESTAYIPYINIALGALMRLVYRVLGQGTAWHTLGQFLLMFAGLTALCHALCVRLGSLRGAAVSLVLLLFFGIDVYTLINYTKTAAVCTVGGMALLLTAAEGAPGQHRAAAVLGFVLTVFGFLLRSMEFLPCFALMAVLCLRPLWGLLASSGAGERLRRLRRLVLPYVLTLAVVAGFYGLNEWAWSKEPWREYHEFDAIRVAYSDYGRPAYEAMPETYDALGLSETDVRMLYEGNYFDPEVFSAEAMQAISGARDANFPPPSWGECLGVFLDKCLPGFFVNLHIYGFLLILALWIAAGEHRFRDWLCLALEAAGFGAMYLYLIYRGRYLVDRVDVGLFLAAAAVLALMLDKEKLRHERMLTVLTLLLALSASWYLTRDSFRTNYDPDKSGTRAAVETLLHDDEHVYLAKLDTVDDGLWSPFEPAGKGYWDRIVLLGGFDCNHPTILNNLARYGVSNPYRDCIGNSRVYLIEDDIDLTLRYLREHYDRGARAELVEPISTETGLAIYRILK